MDSLVSSAARLLAAGDPLGALKRVALRNDPPALGLRGIAMAQLGDYERARQLLRRAARGFGSHERLAQARCQLAEAEVALAARDLTRPMPMLAIAKTLEKLGDRVNALQARLLGARRELLVGELAVTEKILATVKVPDNHLPPALVARAELTKAELALRRVRVAEAAGALERAEAAAVKAGIPALIAEVERVRQALSAPSARLIRGDVVRVVQLEEVEKVFASGQLIADGCRLVVRSPKGVIPFEKRPVLFALFSALAEAWPDDVPRDRLIERAFRANTINESHRARLRVELGRLRTVLRAVAQIQATPRGFLLAPIAASGVVVLAPPVEGRTGSVLALLEGGESWTTSALACALGSSQRTVQRALQDLEEAGTVRSVGHGRSRRWLSPTLGGFATTLLLPGSLAMS